MPSPEVEAELINILSEYLPPADAVRGIPAKIPFTEEEWDVIRRGRLEPGDGKWLIFTKGLSLHIIRRVNDDARYLWTAQFEMQGSACILTRLETLISRPAPPIVFRKDHTQLGHAWFIIETLLLNRAGAEASDYYDSAARFIQEAERRHPMSLPKLAVFKAAQLQEVFKKAAKRPALVPKDELKNLLEVNEKIVRALTSPIDLLSKAQWGLIRREQERAPGYAHEIIADLGFISAERMLEILSAAWNVPVAVLDASVVERIRVDGAASLLPEEFCRKRGVLPLALDEAANVLSVAAADVSGVQGAFLIDDLAARTGCQVRLHLHFPSEINYWINELFPGTTYQ